MKINDLGRVAQNPYNKVKEKAEIASASTKKTKDELQISPEAKALLALQKSQPSRDSRIEALKESVRNGSYHVESEKIADKLKNYFKARE